MEETRNHFNWETFLLGVFFIFASLVTFQNVGSSLVSLVIVYAVFAIIKGGYELYFRRKLKRLTGFKVYVPVIAGVIDILAGVFLLFNLDLGVAFLPYIFSLWFIMDSLCGLLTLDINRSPNQNYYKFSLIINLLGTFIGVLLLFHPIVSALTLDYLIGFYLMMFGVESITASFL